MQIVLFVFLFLVFDTELIAAGIVIVNRLIDSCRYLISHSFVFTIAIVTHHCHISGKSFIVF